MSTRRRVRFGAQRLVRDDQAAAARLLYRVLGVADPAHYLHYRYCRRALDRVAPASPRAILDAGSERGDFTVYLAQRYPAARVDGIEIRDDHLAKAAAGTERLGVANVRYRLGDLRAMEETAEYDVIVCIVVLEHIPVQDEVLRRLLRALRPGGVAFLHVPTRRASRVPLARWLGDFFRWSDDEHIAEERTGDQFTAAVASAGFEILEARPTFGYFAGELATSLFNLPYRDTALNRLLQAAVSPICRLLVLADPWYPGRTRFAIGVTARAPDPRPGPSDAGGPPSR
jgi:SAM-dependent methyltransferase